MNVLITGAGGFVGGHLLEHLRRSFPDAALHGTLLNEAEHRAALDAFQCHLRVIDLCDPDAVRDLVAALRPDWIFHLAGQAYVPRSFEAPWETLENNIRSTLNLLEALRHQKLPARILVVSSAEIYGNAKPETLPLDETATLIPSSPYSVSKIAQDMLAWQYTRAHQVFTVRARPFNHIGPGQNARFAAADWASQIAEAEAGRRAPVVEVGNLSAARDFTDVRDVVRAYTLMLEHGQPGDVFNVCTGQAHTMQSILKTLVSLSAVPVQVREVPERVRPVDIPVLYGTYERLRQRTGWAPRFTIEQSLRDVLDEWRGRVRAPTDRPA